MTAPSAQAAHMWDLLHRAAHSEFALGETSDPLGDPAAGAAFAARVRQLAGGLCAAGLGPGDRVLVHLPKGRDQVAWLWATAVAGGLAVPAPPRLKDDQVEFLLADAAPFAVVTSPERDLLLRRPDRVWAGQRRWGAADHLPGPPLTAAADPDPDQPCILFYSSGSTGPPKAIVQTHRTLVDGARIVSGYLGLEPADRVLAVLPLSFDYGLNQVLGAAWAGCPVILRDYLGGADLARAVAATGATVVAGVPTLWRDLATQPAELLATLRCLTNSGGRWAVADIAALGRALPRAQLHSMYGLTEAFRSTALPPAEIAAHPTSIGRPVAEVELLLVDPATGERIDGAGTGELVHVGAFVGRGYWRRPVETAARFRPDPSGRPAVWSGDLVRRDAEGRFYFETRIDGQLKVDGYRVSPDEVVDAALAHCAGLAAAALVGVDEVGANAPRGHRLVLFAVPQKDRDSGGGRDPVRWGAEVRQQLRAVLPPHLVPAEVRILDALPWTSHGKVDLPELRRLAD